MFISLCACCDDWEEVDDSWFRLGTGRIQQNEALLSAAKKYSMRCKKCIALISLEKFQHAPYVAAYLF